MDRLRWMVGSWSCPKDGGTFEEHWLSPSAGTLQGAGKLVLDDKTVFMEFLSIEEETGGAVMYICLGSLSKGSPRIAKFRLTKLDDKAATFEDPDNEFPSRITYGSGNGQTLQCVLSDWDGTKVDEYAFSRMAD